MLNLGRDERISSSKLLEDLTTIEESPWASWSNGRGLDARSLARMLRPFRIEPHNLRMQAGTVVKGYERGDFEEDGPPTYFPFQPLHRYNPRQHRGLSQWATRYANRL